LRDTSSDSEFHCGFSFHLAEFIFAFSDTFGFCGVVLTRTTDFASLRASFSRFFSTTAMNGFLHRIEFRRQRDGFTLIELLVVLAVIGVLASLLLPAINRAKAQSQGIHCLSQLRQLNLAWIMYASDYNDRLVYNLGGDRAGKIVVTNWSANWVNNVMSWELDPDNTNRSFIAHAKLSPYTGMVPNLYRCPADRVVSEVQRAAGWRSRVRSISMNAMLGYPGSSFRNGVNLNNPGFVQFLRLSSIPDPARIFVFLDEHPDSINDGYFLNNPEDDEWVALPASYHHGSGTISYADGHGERRRWISPSTRRPARPDAAGLPFPVPASERADFDWLMERTSLER
jgi:prepilin-type N-terminal cleavage/methylation domain-containing protein